MFVGLVDIVGMVIYGGIVCRKLFWLEKDGWVCLVCCYEEIWMICLVFLIIVDVDIIILSGGKVSDVV